MCGWVWVDAYVRMVEYARGGGGGGEIDMPA